MKTHPERLLYSVEEAATLIHTSRFTMYGHFRTGKLKPVRMGRRTMLPRSEIERFLSELPPVTLTPIVGVTPRGRPRKHPRVSVSLPSIHIRRKERKTMSDNPRITYAEAMEAMSIENLWLEIEEWLEAMIALYPPEVPTLH